MPETRARPGAEIEDTYPLASIQSDMLIDSMSAPGSGAYVQQAICELREPLEPLLLERAWRTLVARHPILRTRFRLDSARSAVQEVLREVDVPLACADWLDVAPSERDARFEAHLEADATRDFEPERAPALRPALFRLGREHFRFVLTYHHALLDGRSIRRVMREIFDLYDALSFGGEARLEPARPYRTYVEWLAGQDAASAEDFWRTALAGLVASPRPAVEARRASAGVGQGAAELMLSPESTDALRSLAEDNGLTLNTLLLGAWAQLLARYSGETDVAFDTIVALRGDRSDPLRDVLGPCINAVPLRLRADPAMRLLTWLGRVREQWLSMRPHAWLPRAKINLCRDAACTERATSTLMVFERGRLATNVRDDRKGWTRREFSHRSRGGYPLTVVAFELSGLLLKLVYSRAHYDAGTVERMLGHLKCLLEGAIDHGHKPVSDQPLLTPSERHRMLVEWNDTARRFPAERCVHELVAEQAARTPRATAVDSAAGALTYRELDERANRLARYLARRGVAPGTLVGVCLPRTPDLVVALLAILKAGGAYLALDPEHPAERLQAILRDAAAGALVSTRALATRLGVAPESVVALDAEHAGIAAEPTACPEARVGVHDLAYVVYTSGSTGQPKGISIPHSALLNHTFALAEHYAISDSDRRLQFVSVSADVLIADLFPVLIRGGAVVLRSEREPLSIGDFLRFLETRKVTMTGIPSAYWHEWVRAMANGEAAPIPSSLRVVVSGMDSARPELFAIWRSQARANLRWCNAYGPSETTCTATIYEADLSSDAPLATIPIGRPIANVRVYVLDRHAHPVPVGVPGEICIGGRGVSLGYRNRPDLTRESFVRDPFSDAAHDRLYRTGDLGRYLPDGNIEFLGRIDNQIKIRGYRIEPAEIEATLRRQSSVREALVVGAASGGGTRKLVAYVVAHGSRPKAAELRARLRQVLPEYMVPSAIVALDALPRTSNGKVDHAALPTPEIAVEDEAAAYVAPRDALERQIAGIWRKLLGQARIGTRDDFFDLGGDSLLAMRMITAIENAHGVAVALARFFDEATIEGLAAALRASSGGGKKASARRGGGIRSAVAPATAPKDR